MIKNIDSFEELAEANKIMHSMLASIESIDNKNNLSILCTEAIITTLQLVKELGNEQLYDSVSQPLHIILKFMDMYKTTDDPEVIAHYIADKHKEYIKKYLDHIQKSILLNTKKGKDNYDS